MSRWTTTDYTTLKTAIATGAVSVRYADGRSVTYHSLNQMRALLHEMELDLDLVSARAKKTTSKAAWSRD